MAERVHDEFWRLVEPPRRVSTSPLATVCRPVPLARAASKDTFRRLRRRRRCRRRRGIRDAFGEAFPRLRAQHRYIVGDARDVVAAGDTLVCGLHACGGLSDIVIDVALEGSSALALVPCCHSTKIPHDAAAAANVGLEEAIDAARARRLAAAGWAVERDVLCPRDHPQERACIGRPPPATVVNRGALPAGASLLSFGWRGSSAVDVYSDNVS